MESVTVPLPSDIPDWVLHDIAVGHYETPGELIHDALKRMKEALMPHYPFHVAARRFFSDAAEQGFDLIARLSMSVSSGQRMKPFSTP